MAGPQFVQYFVIHRSPQSRMHGLFPIRRVDSISVVSSARRKLTAVSPFFSEYGSSKGFCSCLKARTHSRITWQSVSRLSPAPCLCKFVNKNDLVVQRLDQFASTTIDDDLTAADARHHRDLRPSPIMMHGEPQVTFLQLLSSCNLGLD